MAEKPVVLGAAGGALGLGAFAAAVGGCCAAPWAVALLGVTGAVALARLTFLLPYALGGAAVLLGVAFWWAYRPLPACTGGTCVSTTRRSLRIVVWVATALVAALTALGLISTAAADNPTASGAYVSLDDQASQLREDFNRVNGSVRLLFVVDPICPGCLRGLDDMNRDLLATTRDPRLVTFVVHEPVLGGARFAPWLRTTASHDVPAAAALLHNPYVHHYWSANGEFGRLLSNAVDLKGSQGRVYAWDVWLLYGPDATWSDRGPPRPLLLMHQLSALRGSTEFPHLDSRVFAERALSLLAHLPGGEAASPVTASRSR